MANVDKMQVDSLLGQPSELFLYLHQRWRNREGVDGKGGAEVNEIILDLNRSHNIDFCTLGCDAIDQGISVFDVIQILNDVIPKLNLNVQNTLNLFKRFYDKTKNDGVSYLQYESIKDLVKNQPIIARELLDNLVVWDEPFVSGYISSIFIGFTNGDDQNILDEIKSLKVTTSLYVLYGLINVLGRLNYSTSQNQLLLKQSLELLGEFENHNDENVQASVVHAYGNLLELTTTSIDRILVFSKRGASHTDYALSTILFRNEKYNDQPWFREILMALCRTSVEHKGIIDHLDFVLSKLITKDTGIVREFISGWLIQSDYRRRANNFAKLFDSLATALAQNRIALQEIVTCLLNDDSSSVHEGVADIVSYCSLRGVNNIELDKEKLKVIAFNDLVFISKKILGYIFNSENQCSLSFSLIDAAPRNKKIQNLVYQIFVDHIGEDYPSAVIEFMREKKTIRSSIKKSIAIKVIQKLESVLENRKTLPRIKELQPSSMQVNAILLAQNKVIQESMEKAQKQSFMSLFTHILLKYGNGSFSYRNDEYTQVSKLSSIKSEVELPNSEISFPVYAAFNRTRFRVAKREV